MHKHYNGLKYETHTCTECLLTPPHPISLLAGENPDYLFSCFLVSVPTPLASSNYLLAFVARYLREATTVTIKTEIQQKTHFNVRYMHTTQTPQITQFFFQNRRPVELVGHRIVSVPTGLGIWLSLGVAASLPRGSYASLPALHVPSLSPTDGQLPLVSNIHVCARVKNSLVKTDGILLTINYSGTNLFRTLWLSVQIKGASSFQGWLHTWLKHRYMSKPFHLLFALLPALAC